MESLVASPANGTTTIVDSTVVIEYLASVLQITLGATRYDLENLGSLLSKGKYSDTAQRCARFATESQTALYVQKEIVPQNGDDPSGMPKRFKIMLLKSLY